MKNFNSESFLDKNGKPKFLISGEVHYFRINPDLWKKHLKLLKETGADTVSTYIPWDWHEVEEANFDFDGKTNPARNLIKFIELCQKENLEMIVKPGPYILAEYKNQGLPEWLFNKLSKNAFALDENGEIIAPYLLTYLSDEFLEYTFKWFDNVMPIISDAQVTKGGPISMMQICNEIGVFQWLSGKSDYNPKVVFLFKEFLISKYHSIEKLNSVYNSDFKNFDEIKAPVGKIENKKDYCLYFDFHLFFRHYYNQYITLLKEKIKSYGIEITLTHNIPGWIYGQASELPMLISTYDEILKKHDDIIFGLDHIPEFVSYRNAHSDLACNKILKALQPNAPIWAAEFQCGTREHHTKVYAKELETFYFASIAHGMKGFNYYMFSQGINPNGKGFYGKTFYFYTALNSDGSKNDLYKAIKKVNSFIRKNEKEILNSKTKSEICVGFYKPYFYTELISSQLLKEKKLDVTKLGLSFDPRYVREEIFFNGLLRMLQTLNYEYEIYDLERRNISEIKSFKQFWVITTELMDEETQKFLVDYVKSGGHLIIYPTVPEFDLYLNQCTILIDELNVEFQKFKDNSFIKIFDINDVYSFSNQKLIFSGEDFNPIAFTEDEKICGISKNFGRGKITVLGFLLGYSSNEHLNVIEKILSLDNVNKTMNLDEQELQVTIREGEKKKFIFVLNYHNDKKTFIYKKKKFRVKPYSYEIIIEKIKT
ncbi:MAG: beta-galactosidase [Ignavibacteria bacterium]|nr:beta-galactosidase [Ignavibacteria bacterium]